MRTASLVAGLMMAAMTFAPAAGAQVTFDKQFLRRAYVDSMLELEVANIAQTNTQDAAVQQFAAKLISDHSMALQEIQELADVAGVSLPDELPPQHQAALRRFGRMTGGRFDREFIMFNVRSHVKDIALFRLAAQRARIEAVRDFARDTLPILTEHLRQTLELKDMVLGQRG